MGFTVPKTDTPREKNNARPLQRSAHFYRISKGGDIMPENFGTVLTEVWAQIGDCIDTIIGSPILLLGVGVSFAGAIIGLTKRFIRFGSGKRR